MTGWEKLEAAWEPDVVGSDDDGAPRPSAEAVAMFLRLERSVVVNDEDIATALTTVLEVDEELARTQATQVVDFLLNRGATDIQ